MADEHNIAMTITANGTDPDAAEATFHAEMTDEELLTELTAETVGQSWQDVRIKLTRGDREVYRKIRIQPVDVFSITERIRAIPPEDMAAVLAETAPYRSAAFAEPRHWLETMAVVLYALAPPTTLKDPKTGAIVWRAGGEPQDLLAGIKALPAIGLDMWHINELSKAAMRLTRDMSDADLSGNS